MAFRKVTAYLQERAGADVPFAELLAAGCAPNRSALDGDLSRLSRDPQSGVIRVDRSPNGARGPAGQRGVYRYVEPEPEPEPVYITLRRFGSSIDGNPVAEDEAHGFLYELRLIAARDERAG